MSDGMKRDEVNGLTADDPRFDVMLDLKISKMRGLLDSMTMTSAAVAERAGRSALQGLPFDERFRTLSKSGS